MTKIPDMVRIAKEHGMTAMALTDHGALYGALEFYKTCKKEGIKPIIGVEAYIASRTLHDKDKNFDTKRYHLTLLAKNEIGYRNLLKLVTKSHLEGFYYKPRMDKEILRKYSEGIICLSGCPAGELAYALRAKDLEKGEAIMREYFDIFGEENVFLELMAHPEVEGSDLVTAGVKELAKRLNRPIVGTWDSHYPHTDDATAQDTLIAINTGTDVETKKMSMKNGNYSLIDEKSAQIAFRETPEAVSNTLLVADLCDIELTLGEWQFPELELEPGSTYDEKLRKSVNTGYGERNLKKTKEEVERVEYELSVIFQKGYSPYFLVVGDLMRYARKNGILTSIRGSVAGSLITYLIGITDINPLEYNLPFERFLNPHRPSAPDIDMDFADNRRDEMIEYARKKYGEDRVAQIGTFGTMLARGSVRDVARALGHPYGVGDQIAKLIPLGSQGFPMTIDKAIDLVPELKNLYKEKGTVKEVIDLAKRMEGCARHISVHAAGVVIAPSKLENFVPLQLDPKGGKIITQYDMHACEDAGLVKFDFLGIRNLSIISDAVDRVKKIRDIDIDIYNIPLDDTKTFEMLARGETEGLFQLNGQGLTQFLKQLKPTTIFDINAMVALYRPGPMKNLPEYIARKNGERPVTYYHPKMKKFLDKSYGILVYQDDLLYTAIEIAGYTWKEIDKFRKAVGKKIPEEMAKQHTKFVDGCINYSNMTSKEAEGLWELFEPFQGYGFNKAHAACYGRVAYQTAYMKANYPHEYMTAVLTAEAGDTEEISKQINECKKMGFEVLPPDVNESFSDFTVVLDEEKNVTNKIRFGLRSIKNFGEEIGKAIIHERKELGPFKDISDFLTRVQHKNLNKKSLESLIQSGAMDRFGDRGVLMINVEAMLSFNRELSNKNEEQESLFGNTETNIRPEFIFQKGEKATMEEKLAWEKELLGFYLSGHPLERIREKLESRPVNIQKVKEVFENDMSTTLAGIIVQKREIITKKNQQMAFIIIEDLSGSMEAVVFPDIYSKNREIFEKDTCIAFSGKVSTRGGEKSIIIEKVKIV